MWGQKEGSTPYDKICSFGKGPENVVTCVGDEITVYVDCAVRRLRSQRNEEGGKMHIKRQVRRCRCGDCRKADRPVWTARFPDLL